MGSERMAAGVRLVEKVFRPSLFVLFGFSVGLDPELKVGDLVVDERSDSGLLEALLDSGLSLRVGPIATCGFLGSADKKRAFGERFPASDVADMESESFLKAAPAGSAVLVVRSVSDGVDTDLPLDFERLVDSRGFPDRGAIAREVAKNPMLLPRLMRLAQEAHRATAALAEFFAKNHNALGLYARSRA